MLREIAKYVPIAPLACTLLLFALLPFEREESGRSEPDNEVDPNSVEQPQSLARMDRLPRLFHFPRGSGMLAVSN